MRKIKSAEANRMISNTAKSFPDRCTIDIKGITRNTFGEEINGFVSGSQIDCGFELEGGNTKKKELIVTGTRGVFRLPIDSVVTIEDRLTLIKRYNKTVSYTFDVISEPIKNLDCVSVTAEYVRS